MSRDPLFNVKKPMCLGNRNYHGVGMMAGYTSSFIHQKVMAIISNYLPIGTSILDIGAGHGGFSKRLLENGYSVTAIEKYADFLVKGVKNLKIDLNSNWSLEVDKNYDGVVAIEVIEHLENSFHFMRQVYNVLKSNGYLIITSPNIQSLLSRWYFLFYGKLRMLEHPDHRIPVFEQSIVKLCLEVGFKEIYHTYDMDLLEVSGSYFKLIAKKIIKKFTYMIVRDKGNLIGNSNIWLLQKVPKDKLPSKK